MLPPGSPWVDKCSHFYICGIRFCGQGGDEARARNDRCAEGKDYHGRKFARRAVAVLPTYRHRIKYSPNDGEQEYRPEMIEEQPIGHEVAGVQDDGRQHVQEERVGRQRRNVDAARLEQQQTDDYADGDQQAGLREDLVELRRHVETWIRPNVQC